MLRASASSRRNCHLKRRKRHRVTHACETGEDEDAGGEVLDLMEALRRSVEANRGRKPAAAKKPAAVTEPAAAKKAVSEKQPLLRRNLLLRRSPLLQKSSPRRSSLGSSGPDDWHRAQLFRLT